MESARDDKLIEEKEDEWAKIQESTPRVEQSSLVCGFRRFPGKVIPLYSAGHDDYASKRQTEMGDRR